MPSSNSLAPRLHSAGDQADRNPETKKLLIKPGKAFASRHSQFLYERFIHSLCGLYAPLYPMIQELLETELRDLKTSEHTHSISVSSRGEEENGHVNFDS